MGPATEERPPAAIRTERLLLRGWASADAEPFAALNADEEVMEYFPATHGPEASRELMERAQRQIDRAGYGFWAVEVTQSGRLAGFVGISDVTDAELTFAPAVELGWRLAREFWGRGIAFEAATASLSYGFDEVGLDEIVAYAVSTNERSRGLMERLGMRWDRAADFMHPSLPERHRLAPHVLYGIDRVTWEKRGRASG